MKENLHVGHRRRMFDKLHKLGVDAFNDHELLEVLLFFVLRQRDTNPIAHRLIRYFGSFHAVFEVSREQLQEVEGVGPRVAEFLSFIGSMLRRYQADIARHDSEDARLDTPEKIAAFFVPRFAGRGDEVLCAAYLDNSCRLIRCDEYYGDSTSRVPVNSGVIMRDAVMCSAAAVILSHNHPNGSPEPSSDDISSTLMLASHLRLLDIPVVDHCIVAQGRYYSMSQNGCL